jgi:molybdopterin molybdotransferase
MSPLLQPFTFEQARACVIREASQLTFTRGEPESIPLLEALGRVLAQDVHADRDYPATARSMRDGFAIRAEDIPGTLQVIGEVRAGERWNGAALQARQAIEIMTGAPLPAGANAVVMVEHVTRDGSAITTGQRLSPGDHFNPQGSEASSGSVVLKKGRRLTFADIAQLATIGHAHIPVNRQPTVAILATGDEVIGVEEQPADFQVRNSNSYSLAAQVRRAGGIPKILDVARDVYEHTRSQVELGLQSDLLLLSGGVSAGKYDIVERVLADLGATFFFDRVRVQPGQPLVFGSVRGKLFFGLPGNPASTMVTFEVFARAAVEILSGIRDPKLPLVWASLTHDFHHKTGLRRFLPAVVEDGCVTHVKWSGSSDVSSLSRANAFLVAEADKGDYKQGEMIQVLFHQ